MEKFKAVTGIAVCFPRENIDTGAMIPARFMRSVNEDLGKGLFGDWRYDDNGSPKAEFVLNRAPFTRSRFIVAGDNFGCGSSREAAVWALCQFGIRAVVSSSFGDIFFENALKNGLLPIVLPKTEVAQLMDTLSAIEEPLLTVDLDACDIHVPPDKAIPFCISAGRRFALLNGLDEIGITLTHLDKIRSFRTRELAARPWI